MFPAPKPGVRNYFEYVNSEWGINGREVKVIFEDDRYNIPAALAAFKKLVYRDKILTLEKRCPSPNPC